MAFNSKYIGGLWNNTSRGGTKFMKGSLTINDEVVKVIIFKNSKKKIRRHPDYTVMLDGHSEQTDIMQDDTDEEIE